MNQLKYFDRINAYLEGQMDESTRAAFEVELLENTALREEYDACRASLKALNLLALEELKDIAGGVGSEAKVVPLWRRPWAVAASILLVLGVGLLWFANSNYNKDTLAGRYYVEPNFSPNRSGNNVKLIDQAALAFEEKKYTKAIDIILKIKRSDPDYEYGQFIIGHAYLKNNQPLQGSSSFAFINNDEWEDNAKWHQAISLIKSGEIDSAKNVLLNISKNNKSNYKNMADDLLKKLNSGWRYLVF